MFLIGKMNGSASLDGALARDVLGGVVFQRVAAGGKWEEHGTMALGQFLRSTWMHGENCCQTSKF